MINHPFYDPVDEHTHADPYPVYERLRHEAPLSFNAQRGWWALARHDDVAAALQDRETFASSTESLSTADRYIGLREARYIAGDSPRHDALREALRPLLGPRPVAALEREIARIAHDLLDELVGSGTIDLAAGYARRLPVLVTCSLLGLPHADEQPIAGAVDAVFGRSAGVLEVPAAAADAYRDMSAYLHDRTGAGLASLEDARERGVITAEEVIDLALIVIAAGIKTTSTLISTMLLSLSRDGVQAEMTWRDRNRIPDVVEETLRHDAPAQWVSRVTTRDAATECGVIPAGARVLLLLGSANRDERRYPDPDRFDPGRERRRHLAFGGGMHFCSGAPLARLEAQVALATLCSRATVPTPAGTPTRIFTPAERELARLPLHLTVHPR